MENKTNRIKILELFSGIGGMHLAFLASELSGQVVLSVDINTTANTVYTHNFPHTKLLNRNIQSLSAKFINELAANVILMSPPCQPFTRNGLKRDEDDARSCAFIHLLQILPELKVEYLLIENVKGFEKSLTRDILTQALRLSKFHYQEFILSPHQYGVPNSRHRYYCVARKRAFIFDTNINTISSIIPGLQEQTECSKITDILENNLDIVPYVVPDAVLRKRADIIDIVNPDSSRSCCFTKSYGRYVEGTGSIYTNKSSIDIDSTYAKLSLLTKESAEYLEIIKSLQLRFFTPLEVSRLMNIPNTFTFPANITKKQKYRLLGNSINVKVVSELINLLFK